jgi:serine/threonine-protein kinase
MRFRRHVPTGTNWRGGWEALKRDRPRRSLLTYAGTFLGAAAVGYAIAALAFFPAPIFAASKSVPRVIGLKLDAAQSAIAGAGLTTDRPEDVRHPTAPAGTVVWQDPPPDVVVPQGSSVHLEVSQGPQRVPIPDVVGYEEDIARNLIEAAGLAVSVDSAQTAAPKGVVVNTRPPAGRALVPGTRVTLVVSVGAPIIRIPDLTGLTLEEARATLEQAGLTLGTYFRRSSDQKPGTVIEQRPSTGTLSAPGVAVDVILARSGSGGA